MRQGLLTICRLPVNGEIRGFALPRLLRWYSPLIASLVLGLSIVMTWLFLRPRRSVIPAMLFHGGTNVVGSYLAASIRKT